MNQIRRHRRVARRYGLGLAAVLLTVSVACTGTNPPTGHPPQPNQTTNFATAFEDFQRTNTDPNKRPWFCHALGGGEHQHHASNGVVQGPDNPTPPEYVGLQRGNLSWDDCRKNAYDLQAAKTYAEQYPTKADAQRAGFTQTVQYLAGMGSHLQNFRYTGFNPKQPNTLQYDGDLPTSRLIGMSWLIPGTATNPPDGFAGTNDVWHLHHHLCRNGLSLSSPVVGNNLTTLAACRAAGGTTNQAIGNMWMVHAWIIENWQYQTDVNNGMHPCLLANGPAAANDSCWALAQHDHTHQPGDHDAPGEHDAHGH